MLPYSHHCVDEADITAVVETLRSEWLTTGPMVRKYEEAFAQQVVATHTVAVNSGTAALHAALFAVDIRPGDEVITSPMTFAATANSILYLGARPVFADVQPDTLNVDPKAVAAAITPKTKAILAVDYTGQPADLQELGSLAKSAGIALIEDAAHALGATYRTRPVGGISDVTAFSTHPVKHITTGEGGMSATNDTKLAQRMRWFRNHGITSDHHQRAEEDSWFYEMIALGYNYRLPDINCALGLSQLRKLGAWLARRTEIAEQYSEAFKKMPAIQPLAQRSDRTSGWHLYVVQLDLDALRVDRAQVFAALRAENIGVNVHYIPVHLHPFYRQKLGTAPGLCPVAEGAYERILTLPLFPTMSEADVKDVVEAVLKVTSAFSI
jgi:perosamine synthetase